MNTEHILLVEDDPLVRGLVRTALQEQGFRVTTSINVSEALRAIRTEMPHLILLDLNLPDQDFNALTDGFSFLRLLHRANPAANVSVVVHSVDDSPAAEARAKSLGVFAVLKKGTEMPVLLDTVRKALDERNAKVAR